MGRYPYVMITSIMIDEAKRWVPITKVEQTVTSKIDTLTGHLGEFVFAQFLFKDWRRNNVGFNKGENDFGNIEIKTSAFPISEKLNLLVREDYGRKRKPEYYVHIIIDVANGKAESIEENSKAYLCGYATCEALDNAPSKDFGSKLANQGGYRCHFIRITNLNPIEELKEIILKRKSLKGRLYRRVIFYFRLLIYNSGKILLAFKIPFIVHANFLPSVGRLPN